MVRYAHQSNVTRLDWHCIFKLSKSSSCIEPELKEAVEVWLSDAVSVVGYRRPKLSTIWEDTMVYAQVVVPEGAMLECRSSLGALRRQV